jgi:hypothetical protein
MIAANTKIPFLWERLLNKINKKATHSSEVSVLLVAKAAAKGKISLRLALQTLQRCFKYE